EINDNQFKITLLDDDGNPISNQKVNITIDGVNYEVTSDANGVVSVALNHLSNDKYIVSVTNPVTGEIITQVIEISKKEEKHTEFNWISQNKDIIMYYGVSKYYTVRVCDNNGKYVSGIKVIFVFKGINYVAYSNPNGYASIKLSLKPGKYTIYVKYHDKTVSNKITVKQTLTAKNIKVKKGKTIKFQAKLVNTNGKALKNKKILFKFKGKNYKAKTNKKGIANLKIKLKLKVGKYTIKTSYGKNSIKNTIQIQK
ncbi:MAG: Ig-like domain-containing protein, partial [Methanobrevibacter sp.]|nr:Ig-like domain-containing protein [Methanobrevibacter sp.]